MYRLTVAASGIAISLTLAGCTQAGPTPPTVAAASPAPTPSASGDPSTKQGPSAAALTPALAKSAIAAAHELITAYARPQLSETAWLAGMDPLLTQDAGSAFEHTDPATIPAHQVAGPVSLSAESTGNGAIATVPTDAGTYTVLLLRDQQARAWLAETITPPGH